MSAPGRLALLALAGGIAAGALLWLLTDTAARSSIGGDGWSLRGNGALVILFAGVPAVLGGGWAALALLGTGRPLVPGVLASGLVLLVLGVAASFFPIILPVILVGPLLLAVAAVWSDRRLFVACLTLPLGLLVGLMAPSRAFGLG